MKLVNKIKTKNKLWQNLEYHKAKRNNKHNIKQNGIMKNYKSLKTVFYNVEFFYTTSRQFYKLSYILYPHFEVGHE